MPNIHDATKTITARINSWMYTRQIRILPDQVGLQVTVPSCSHCHTCQKRVQEFSNTLARKPDVIHQWKYVGDGAEWLFFPRKKGNPLDVLRRNLEIRIEEY